MNILKTIRVLALIGTFLCLGFAAMAQTGSTGRPNTDWEIDKVCVEINGVDSSLTRRSLFVEGANNDEPVFTKYYDAAGNLVTIPNNAPITLGLCKDAVEAQTTQLSHSIVEMCDFDEVAATYTPFIRVFMVVTDLSGSTLSTSKALDMTYDGVAYTPTGTVGLGLCAAVEDAETADLEYSTLCMVDVQSNGTEVVFYRLLNHHDSTVTNVNDSYAAYNITGAVQPCSDKEVVSVESLCDIATVDLGIAWNIQDKGDRIVGVQRVDQSLASFIQVVKGITYDCGNGQISQRSNPFFCDCDYSQSPDGEYTVTASIELVNQGDLVIAVTEVDVIDGQVYFDDNLPGTTTTVTYPNIISSSTQFFRKFKQDGTFEDVDIDGNPYAITGTSSFECDNTNRYSHDHELSSVPDMEIISDKYCWAKTIATNGNDWKIENVVATGNIFLNATDTEIDNFVPRSGDDLTFIVALQNKLDELGFSYASVSFENGTIYIRGLDPAVTSITTTDEGPANPTNIGAITFEPYSGDSVLFYNVYRFASNGQVANVIGHFGEETALTDDVKKVQCVAEEECVVQNVPEVVNISGGIFTYTAGTYNAIDISPITTGVIVTVGSNTPVAYPQWYANRLAAGDCAYLSEDITIDVSGAGVSALVTLLK